MVKFRLISPGLGAINTLGYNGIPLYIIDISPNQIGIATNHMIFSFAKFFGRTLSFFSAVSWRGKVSGVEPLVDPLLMLRYCDLVAMSCTANTTIWACLKTGYTGTPNFDLF